MNLAPQCFAGHEMITETKANYLFYSGLFIPFIYSYLVLDKIVCSMWLHEIVYGSGAFLQHLAQVNNVL